MEDRTAAYDGIRVRLERGLAAERAKQRGGAAILIPLVEGESGWEVLFEVRAAHLAKQPGEVCFPGGHIEPGETPEQAAVRETCEELRVHSNHVVVIADLGRVDGPGGMPLAVFAGVLEGYAGSFDATEVDRTFSMPLSWFQEHEPRVFEGALVPDVPDGFPWGLVPHGREYPWRRRRHDIPFYMGTDPVIWGFTARMLARFVKLLGPGAVNGG